MSRLLPEEETQEARKLGGQEYMLALEHSVAIPSLDECCNNRQNLAQDTKTHKETLKAVGELLERRMYNRVEDMALLYGLIEAFKGGEMPEEAK